MHAIYQNLIAMDRWKLILEGLGNTIIIALGAIVIGTLIGAAMALMRVSGNRVLGGIARGYITVIRGIPMVTQLMIFNFIIFAPTGMAEARDRDRQLRCELGRLLRGDLPRGHPGVPLGQTGRPGGRSRAGHGADHVVDRHPACGQGGAPHLHQRVRRALRRRRSPATSRSWT